MTHDQLNQRLESLQREHDAGKRMLAELGAKRRDLNATMLRIEGAMQVLREMMEQEQQQQQQQQQAASQVSSNGAAPREPIAQSAGEQPAAS